jgi:hypothetical protein
MELLNLPARLDDLIDYTRQQHPGGGALAHLTDAVLVANHLGDVADHLVGHFVDQARRAGASWTEIGQAMGVSKQAAQKRFVPRPEEIEANSGRYDKFTERAKRVLLNSQEEARRMGKRQANSLHVVLGLLAESEGIAALAINAQGVELDQLRQAARQALEDRADESETPPEHLPPPTPIEFGADATKALEMALREALRFGHNYIGTEHILLGLLRADETAGARLLTDAGVTHQQSEEWILAALEGYRRARASGS